MLLIIVAICILMPLLAKLIIRSSDDIKVSQSLFCQKPLISQIKMAKGIYEAKVVKVEEADAPCFYHIEINKTLFGKDIENGRVKEIFDESYYNNAKTSSPVECLSLGETALLFVADEKTDDGVLICGNSSLVTEEQNIYDIHQKEKFSF